MPFAEKEDHELQVRSRKELLEVKDPITKLRWQCLARGAQGIKGFGRQFQVMDDNRDKKLVKDEFKKGCDEFGVNLSAEEVDQLFQQLDKDNSGSIDFTEFLVALRPPLSESRVSIIKKAFQKMDKTGDGVITVADMKGVYNARQHPKYKNGEWSEERVFEEFLKSFDTPNSSDGKVTEDEFMNYYCAISASIDDDCYFDLMMRNSFKL